MCKGTIREHFENTTLDILCSSCKCGFKDSDKLAEQHLVKLIELLR